MRSHTFISSIIAAAFVVSGCSTKPRSIEPATQASQDQASASESRPGIAPGSAEDFKVNVGDTIRFAYEAHELDDQARGVLEKQASWLVRYPGVKLIIEGHCDERGTREYNLALGARRANAIREHLVSRGVPLGRLQTVSFGKEHPLCNEAGENCWGQNRRGVSVVTADTAS